MYRDVYSRTNRKVISPPVIPRSPDQGLIGVFLYPDYLDKARIFQANKKVLKSLSAMSFAGPTLK